MSNILSAGTGNALSCAEHAIYLALATLRDQNSMAASIQRQRLGVPLGQTLYGKTVLIVGFGNIAKELIPRWAALCCCPVVAAAPCTVPFRLQCVTVAAVHHLLIQHLLCNKLCGQVAGTTMLHSAGCSVLHYALKCCYARIAGGQLQHSSSGCAAASSSPQPNPHACRQQASSPTWDVAERLCCPAPRSPGSLWAAALLHQMQRSLSCLHHAHRQHCRQRCTSCPSSGSPGA